MFAIVISCLGLYGLSVFIIHRKTKEIGIRKVNGAGVLEIIRMLNQNIAWRVLISFSLATPPVCYFMKIWLANFAYKIQISWWIFVMAGLMVLVLSLLTVSVQSFRAASMNPARALKHE